MVLHEDILSFLDLLDLDEEIVDTKLRSLMMRNNHTNTRLFNIIQLLKYKQLINIQENTECENNEECDFIVKLIKDLNEENIKNVCEIINIVLGLNTSSIVSKSEHLLQQILSSIFPLGTLQSTYTILQLQVCDSIFDAVLKSGNKVSLLLLEVPLEDILETHDEKLKINFLINTVPHLFEGVIDYNILDRIWKYVLKQKCGMKDVGLKILSCLSDYYIPAADNEGITKFETDVIYQYDFWNLILYGLMSDDTTVRKTSVYLMKRSIDYISGLKKNISVKNETGTIFTWEYKNENQHKAMWDNFFILLDSLEEKQSNIVLPSLQLLNKLNDFESCWLNTAFNLGLKHINNQVRLKCIEYKLDRNIYLESEAVVLLEALNDINVYDHPAECKELKIKLNSQFKNRSTFLTIFKAIPSVNWSPVPLYHLSTVLGDMKSVILLESTALRQIINDILKIPCSIVAIRKAVHINISHLIGNCCATLNWKELLHIYSAFHLKFSNDNPFIKCIKDKINKDNVKEFEKFIIETGLSVDISQLCDTHNGDKYDCVAINEIMNTIENVVKRQYSDKTECLKEVLFITQLFSKMNTADLNLEYINIARQYKTILSYVLSLLSDDTVLTIEDTILLFERLDAIFLFNHSDLLEIELQLYKSSVLFLNDKNTELYKAVYSIHILNSLSKSYVLCSKYKHEMLNLETILELLNKIEFNVVSNAQSGRLRNIFYEKSSEIIDLLTKDQDKIVVQSVIDFVEKVVDFGGYGCLKWILRIINKILNKILDEEHCKFNITQFINRMWNEIEELKSNNQYAPCIKEFVFLITQDSLLKKPMYNNIVISYCSKIIENGPLRNTPLYYLIEKLKGKDMEEYGQLVYVLCEILLYAPVPRKDQRIIDNLVIDILHSSKYGLRDEHTDTHFNYQIQYISIECLTNIKDQETLSIITSYITKKVDDMFKTKMRYHRNSQLHLFLLTALQHLIIIVTKSELNVELMLWCVQLLGKLPHEPSVRICLEWYISLYLYIKNVPINKKTLEMLISNNVPLSSQLMIIYWVMKHKLKVSKDLKESSELEFVMETLFSHTMGHLFNVRLHAQYLSSKLYKMCKNDKYEYVIRIIESTFADNSTDRNLIKLKEDYFTNEFDIVGNLTPYFIYHLLPRYCHVTTNENIDLAYVEMVTEDITVRLNTNNNNDDFTVERIQSEISVRNEIRFYEMEMKTSQSEDGIGTIQKKYVPWRNMSDVNVYDVGKKRESQSDLIVVASLIDKLPNLGGMARTSEVFGVKTYVVDSLRHLQDKQFQVLSVSAERWIDIEEVRPGRPLKDYLNKKKSEGYSVVAAEQTSTSCRLQGFKFPKKTLLLLGHEKEGVPCDLLPMMDHCVEIPQQGYVRSLNVHVTAAIFVWEYARQNIL